MTEEAALVEELGNARAKPRTVPPLVPFEGFVAARSDHLLRTAYLLTRDHQLAEDLLQTALAKAWGAWKRIGTDHEAYVRRILVNTYASWWRRKWNGERPSEQLPESGGPNPTDTVGDRFDLWEAIGRLPKRQRATLVLRFYEDLTEAETAEMLGCTAGTVKSQTSKALAKLRIDPALLETYASRRHDEGGRS